MKCVGTPRYRGGLVVSPGESLGSVESAQWRHLDVVPPFGALRSETRQFVTCCDPLVLSLSKVDHPGHYARRRRRVQDDAFVGTDQIPPSSPLMVR